MQKLKSYIDKLKAATPDVQQEALRKIREQNKKYMVDLIKDQLMHGIDADFNLLTPYKSASYAAFKKTLNPLGVTDLKLKGSFHKGIFADVSGEQTVFGSTDSKTPELLKKYGDVLNLTEQSKEVLIEERFKPAAIRWYKKLYKFR